MKRRKDRYKFRMHRIEGFLKARKDNNHERFPPPTPTTSSRIIKINVVNFFVFYQRCVCINKINKLVSLR